MIDFTVAIPTYNGEQRLPEVLARLRSQIIPAQLSWEVIVIDNNSRDRTAEIVTGFQPDFPCPLRYCLELNQGAAYARKRALQEATSEWIGFLDDDNLPEMNWVASAYQFAQAHPDAGAFASQIRGEFEVAPTPELKPLLPFLALTDRGSQPSCYKPQHKILPPSAGLVVRKQAWVSSVPESTILGGRVEGNMLTGEDLEVLAHIQRSGWEIWYNPAMQITHKIPAWRLEGTYLIPFFRGIGLSRFVTRMASVQPWQRSVIFVAYLINDLRKMILHFLKHGWQIESNLAVVCERELMWHSLLSPFYLWKKGYLRKQKE